MNRLTCPKNGIKPNISYNLINDTSCFTRMIIYNIDLPYPMHKFHFMVENTKILKITNKHITVALGNTKANNAFVEYIISLENTIRNTLLKIYPNICINYTFDGKPVNTIGLSINNNTYIDLLKYLNQDDIYFNIVIELCNTMHNDTEIWFSYSLLEYKMNDLRTKYFIHDVCIEHVSKQNTPQIPPMPISAPIPPPPPLPILPLPHVVHKKQTNINIKPQQFTISQNDIANQIKKMQENKEKNKQSKYQSIQDDLEYLSIINTFDINSDIDKYHKSSFNKSYNDLITKYLLCDISHDI